VRVAGALHNFALALQQDGDLEGAASLYERVLEIAEAKLGPDHPNVAKTLNNLAGIYHSTQRFTEARRLYERVLEIREKALGPDHPHMAKALANLGILLRGMGDYREARALLERALAIYEEAFGPEHLDVAAAMTELAITVSDMGDYVEARPLYERALEIREKILGPEHPEVAASIGRLGTLLWEIRDYEGAKSLYERALALQEKLLGPEHPKVAVCLNNLGLLLTDMGKFQEARFPLERALAIREKSFGPDHPKVAQTLNNLARLLLATGKVAEARPLLERALEIREKVLGADHPMLARILLNLVDLNAEAGDWGKALALCERALEIQRKAFGEDHPYVAETLGMLATLLARTGEVERALESALRSESVRRDHARITGASLAERQALRYALRGQPGLDVALSLATGELDQGSTRRVWSALVNARALVLDVMAARRHAAAETARAAQAAGEWTKAAQEVQDLLVRGPGDQSGEAYQALLREARAGAEEAQRSFAEHSLAFRREESRWRLDLRDVAAALPRGSALIAYVRYSRREVAPRKGEKDDGERAGGPEDGPGPSYLAFVLGPDRERIEVVSLGPAEAIEALVSRWKERAALGAEALLDPEVAEREYRVAGEALRKRVWDPVAPHLGEAKRVFVVPDGPLHLVNLAALPSGQDRYLVEEDRVIHYVSAERDLAGAGARKGRGRGLLALGGPAFDETSLFAALMPKPEEPEEKPSALMAALSLFRGGLSDCEDLRTIRFADLPASAEEAGEVARLWREAGGAYRRVPEAVRLTGAAASETAFKQKAPGSRVLHLATHGFFLGGDCVRGPGTTRGIAGMVVEDSKTSPLVPARNPLLLSGLALAGANNRAAAGPGEDDGILTAEEVASLDLSGTEWVVLSACETGLGRIEASEGVFGLRRAFQVAGAGTLIMSLWSVEDEATRAWMRALYEARLIQRMDTAEAVRQASLEVLRSRREAGESTHPFFWGAFVAAGDWR